MGTHDRASDGVPSDRLQPMALGEVVVTAPPSRLPRAIVKWVSLYTPMPWPAGLPTNPELDQEVGGRGRATLLATWPPSRRLWSG